MRKKQFSIHNFTFTVKYPKPESREPGRELHINIFFGLILVLNVALRDVWDDTLFSKAPYVNLVGFLFLFHVTVNMVLWRRRRCQLWSSVERAFLLVGQYGYLSREKFTIFHYYNGKVLHVFSGWSAILNFWRQKCYMHFGYSVLSAKTALCTKRHFTKDDIYYRYLFHANSQRL